LGNIESVVKKIDRYLGQKDGFFEPRK